MKILAAFICISLFVTFSGFRGELHKSGSSKNKTPADYVNPFIGTEEMGHTFPGAAVPFGMVQLSPETDTAYYSYGNGYNPDDRW